MKLGGWTWCIRGSVHKGGRTLNFDSAADAVDGWRTRQEHLGLAGLQAADRARTMRRLIYGTEQIAACSSPNLPLPGLRVIDASSRASCASAMGFARAHHAQWTNAIRPGLHRSVV